VTTRILNQLESHPTTRQHHRDLADHLRGRRRRKGTSVHAPSLAIRSTKHQIKSLDAEHSKLRSLEAIQKKRKQWTKPETANRTIFKTRKEGPHQADAWPSRPSHGIVTDDPKHTRRSSSSTSVPWAAPKGHKHGTYQTTSDARTDYPWERPQSTRSNWKQGD
jgi:hypothetical protein